MESWPLRRDPEWTRRPGASPPMRMHASWYWSDDQPNTSLRRDNRVQAGSPRKSSSCRHGNLLVVTSSCAGLATARAASLRDGLRPPLTVAPPGRPAGLRLRREDAGRRRTRRSLKCPDTESLDQAPYKYSRDAERWNRETAATGFPHPRNDSSVRAPHPRHCERSEQSMEPQESYKDHSRRRGAAGSAHRARSCGRSDARRTGGTI